MKNKFNSKLYSNTKFSLIIFSCCLSFSVAAENLQVPTIYVKKPQLDSITRTTEAALDILSDQQISTSGTDVLPPLLNRIGGVQLQELSDNSNPSISIRGFGANAAANSLILVDGIPLTNPDLAAPNINLTALQNIDHVEIIQGGEGVLFGNQAVGGVINIITKKPQRKLIQGKIGGGSYGHQLYQLKIENVFTNGWSYTISGITDVNNNYRDHNKNDDKNIFGRLRYQYLKGFVDLNYQINKLLQQLSGALTIQQMQTNPRLAQNYKNYTKNDDQFFHIKQKHFFNENYFLETDFSHRTASSNGLIFLLFNQAKTINLINPKLFLNFDYFSIVSGLSLLNEGYQLVDNPYFTKNSNQQGDLYSQVSIPCPNNIKINFGLRAALQNNYLQDKTIINQFSRHATVANIGLQWILQPNLRFFLRSNTNFRFPKADELALLHDNAILNTQKGISYEAGTVISKNFWRGKFNFYELLIHDEIAFDPFSTASHPFGVNRNLDLTRRLGFITEHYFMMSPNLTLSGQYSYVDARFLRGNYQGHRIPFVATNTYDILLTYKHNKYCDLTLENQFTGGRYAVGDDYNRNIKIPNFFIMNFNANFNYQDFLFQFRLNNIFNHHYILMANFVPSMRAIYFYPSSGRNFLLSISYPWA